MISDNVIKKVFSKVLPNAKIEYVKKYSKGQVNEVFFVSAFNQRTELSEEFVFRVYPKDGWKAKKEKYVYELIRKDTDVPVPDVVIADSSKKIIRYSYSILRKIPGEDIRRKKNSRLVKEAGRMLAKIHTIKFDKFGWIVGRAIKPKFSGWIDFLRFDLDHKLEKLEGHISDKMKDDMVSFFDANKDMMDVDVVPCLLHKDYSYSHIIADKEITGIIDVEWAMAGHNELDLVKSLVWMFPRNKKLEKVFLSGYLEGGRVSKLFDKRRKVYEVLIFINSLAFSTECRSRKWCRYNMNKLKRLLYGKDS